MGQQSEVAENAAPPGTGQQRGLWAWIQDRINLALYRPRAAAGVVASRLTGREGVHYVLRSPDANSYLKLAEEDYFLWTHMDGGHNVKDLVVLYFLEFGAFAFDRVGQLVRELRQGGFLADRPVQVLAHVHAQLEARDLVSWGRRLASAFVHHEIPMRNIDGGLAHLYRFTEWIFAWPVQLLILLVIVAGLAIFAGTLAQNELPLFTVGGSFWWGVVALLAIQALMILLHELAHGLATKHYGRRVRRGGFLIYYGYPAFFVDTMDMWLENRWARIAVSWAGPHSGLVIGGLAALLTGALFETPLAPWLFKTAFVAYLSVFLNLNPLLELDGYFILIDLLEIPMLRQRAFRFVREQLWTELRDARRKLCQRQSDWLAGFTREERLLAAFGLLAAIYTTYSTWLAVYFWETQVATALRELWSRSGWVNRLVLVCLAALLVAVAGAALLAQLLAWSQRLWAWFAQRGFFKRDRHVHGFLLSLLLLFILGPVFLSDPLWGRYLALMPPALLGLAGVALARVTRRYEGAGFQRVFWALLAAVGLFGLASLLRVPVYWRYAAPSVPLLSPTAPPTLLALAHGLERLAGFPLALAGFLGLSRVELRRIPPGERALTFVLILLAGLVAVQVSRWTDGLPLAGALFRVSSTYLLLLFVALALPNAAAFARTPFFVPACVLLAAALLTGVVGLLRVMPQPPAPDSDLGRWLALVVAAMWAYAAVLHDLAAQRLRFRPATSSDALVVSEEERLQDTFARFGASLFGSFGDAFGLRRAQAVNAELNILASSAGWDIHVEDGRIRDRLDLTRLTIWEQAERYRELSTEAINLMDRRAGDPFVIRAVQAAYDSLSWPDREVLGRYVLADSPWGAGVAARFASQHDVRWRLVRALPLFRHCDERALGLIVAALEREHVRPGTLVARQGTALHHFYLVESGEVEVWRRDAPGGLTHLVGELRRGASFGDGAFFGAGRYDATYRAGSPASLLVLGADRCDRLLRSGVALATRVGASLEVVRLLSGMPLFGHLSPQQLSAVAARVRRRQTVGSQIVAHMGAERHSLFIVLRGVVEALADDAEGNKYLAHVYTAGEHFGEYALFADTPYRFTYRTRGPATLLTLDEATFDTLVAQSDRMASYVEQMGSGRLLIAQRKRT